jgi:hypothetical protein
MIGAFLVNRIPACFVAEITTAGVVADEGEERRQDKEPRCVVQSDGESVRVSEAISRCARLLRDVHYRHFRTLSDGSCTSRENRHAPG